MTDCFGAPVWDDLLAKAAIGPKLYLAIQEYPDEELNAILQAASTHTGLPIAAILQDFGDFTGPHLVRMWAEVVILAVPFSAVEETLQKMGDALNGKVLVDVTNALDENMALAVGCTTSGAEELQKKAGGARVVKAFNTVFAQHMDTGRLGDEMLTVFAAADDEDARNTVLELATAIGFDTISAGPLQNARWLETLGYLNIQLGYVVGHGVATGFHYIH